MWKQLGSVMSLTVVLTGCGQLFGDKSKDAPPPETEIQTAATPRSNGSHPSTGTVSPSPSPRNPVPAAPKPMRELLPASVSEKFHWKSKTDQLLLLPRQGALVSGSKLTINQRSESIVNIGGQFQLMIDRGVKSIASEVAAKHGREFGWMKWTSRRLAAVPFVDKADDVKCSTVNGIRSCQIEDAYGRRSAGTFSDVAVMGLESPEGVLNFTAQLQSDWAGSYAIAVGKNEPLSTLFRLELAVRPSAMTGKSHIFKVDWQKLREHVRTTASHKCPHICDYPTIKRILTDSSSFVVPSDVEDPDRAVDYFLGAYRHMLFQKVHVRDIGQTVYFFDDSLVDPKHWPGSSVNIQVSTFDEAPVYNLSMDF